MRFTCASADTGAASGRSRRTSEQGGGGHEPDLGERLEHRRVSGRIKPRLHPIDVDRPPPFWASSTTA